MTAAELWWIIFGGFVFGMLALDLGVFHRKAHEVRVQEALIWTAVWVALAGLLGAGILWLGIGGYEAGARHEAGLEFFTGYLIELSLSVDNVFVFALIFTHFQVRPAYRHRVLFWGILGALLMRGVMIFGGVALLESFHWVTYLLAAVLIYGGIKLFQGIAPEVDPERSLILRGARKVFRIAREEQGGKFVVTEQGHWMISPLCVVLLLVEWTDLVFAVDSIPAVLTITQDRFIVFTSNVMAILGLRSLYFALAGAMHKFHLLHYGLAVILILVGVKMLAASFYAVPVLVVLAVVAFILVSAVMASLRWPAPVETPAGSTVVKAT